MAQTEASHEVKDVFPYPFNPISHPYWAVDLSHPLRGFPVLKMQAPDLQGSLAVTVVPVT
ncbi:hypothetical protein PAXRUDRAFT_18720 [Paxillus rubicundulus Ve08.2h10]|uniref:Uncharacterized protein n=1 Tax=Paxillus rubicundulus Ve08.2h10 TaxID=930991 RepID=A0A0D0BWU3_9AGAM|nr:hypothetical protein PAXRUDRAFT_18720 [Paxillus rubicundulus Ve08.2h10]